MGITTVDSYVSSWTDQSASGFVVAQEDPNKRPMFVDSEALFNGCPALRLGTHGEPIEGLTSTTQAEITTSLTLFVAQYLRNTEGSKQNKTFGFPGASPKLYDTVGFPSTGHGIQMNFGTKLTVVNSIGTHIWTAIFAGALSSVKHESSSEVTGTLIDWTGTDYFSVGNIDGFSNQDSGHRIAEVILYTGILSPENRTTVVNYMRSRYGV
jgi:hypothetical protein